MTSDIIPLLPYCGLAAQPGSLWTRWNLDPWLIGGFLLVAIAYGLARRRVEVAARPAGQVAFFYAGWAVALLTLISPLCALSIALFSARVGQHVILVLIAAPLLVMGGIDTLFRLPAGVPALKTAPVWRSLVGVLSSGRTACAAFAAALWFWHAPGPYSETFFSAGAYWSMHASLLGAAVLLWRAILVKYRDKPMAALIAGLVTACHMGLLGGLLTFARRPLYLEHWNDALAWGYTPLNDQQLGGLILWIPGCSVFLVVAMAAATALLFDAELLSRSRDGEAGRYRVM